MANSIQMVHCTRIRNKKNMKPGFASPHSFLIKECKEIDGPDLCKFKDKCPEYQFQELRHMEVLSSFISSQNERD
jgi:hypothetical protein